MIRFIKFLFRGNRVIDMKTRRKTSCQRPVCRLSTENTRRFQPAENTTLWISFAEKVWILYLRDAEAWQFANVREIRIKKGKTANEGVGPVFRYQMFFFTFILTEGKMPNYLDSVYAKIYFHACAKKSMNFVNRIYRARYHPRPVQTILSLRGTSAVRQK